MTAIRAFAHSDAGATVVEFALVTPVLILLLVACLDVARALNAYVIVANASREGARYATVHPELIAADPATRWGAVKGYLATRVAPLDPSGLKGTVTYVPLNDGRWTGQAAAPQTVNVVVSYRWNAATWIVGSFFADACLCRTFSTSSSMQVVR